MSLNWENKTLWTHLKKNKSTKDKKSSNKDNKKFFSKLINAHSNPKSTIYPNLSIKIKRKKSKLLISSKMLPKTHDLKKILINQQKLYILINKMKIKKTLLLTKFFLNCKSLNQDSKNFMKIIKLFNKRSNTFDKKVCNRYHLNLKSIKFQKK